MTPGERLSKQLMAEADRRQAQGDYVVAHELRARASEVMGAETYLRASKSYRKPRDPEVRRL